MYERFRRKLQQYESVNAAGMKCHTAAALPSRYLLENT